MLLCVLVKGTGCARGLSGLEGAWDREEDIPGHDNLTGKGKWQTQNTIAISQNQFNSRESKQGSHNSLVTGRGGEDAQCPDKVGRTDPKFRNGRLSYMSCISYILPHPKLAWMMRED